MQTIIISEERLKTYFQLEKKKKKASNWKHWKGFKKNFQMAQLHRIIQPWTIVTHIARTPFK